MASSDPPAPNSTSAPDSAVPAERGADPERKIDWFLPAVALAGLGLVALLVYIYWQ
jgi:hypothetical protein